MSACVDVPGALAPPARTALPSRAVATLLGVCAVSIAIFNYPQAVRTGRRGVGSRQVGAPSERDPGV